MTPPHHLETTRVREYARAFASALERAQDVKEVGVIACLPGGCRSAGSVAGSALHRGRYSRLSLKGGLATT